MTGDKEFRDIADHLGSAFAAVNYIASEARHLATTRDESILDSEAISWVLTGQCPEHLKIPRSHSISGRSYMHELLVNVDNPDIVRSVAATMRRSTGLKLNYTYTQSLNESQKARVRILCNMIRHHDEQDLV